jgi:hypothetical protein
MAHSQQVKLMLPLADAKTLNSLNLYQELKIRDAMVDSAIKDFHKENF